MAKIHWSGGSADLRIGCERERGNRFGSILHRSWTSSVFVERATASPDHYCAHCVKAARLALAAESAPKVDTRTDSDRYVELRKLVEDCQREAMDPASPLVVFDNALRLVLDWRHR